MFIRRTGHLHICYRMRISTSSLEYCKNSKCVSNDGRPFWQSRYAHSIHFIKFVILIIFSIDFSVTYEHSKQKKKKKKKKKKKILHNVLRKKKL